VLIELCAGSAAVACAWMKTECAPPLYWQGSKRSYARQLLPLLGLAPGAGCSERVVLCEPGPWGEAWTHWRTGAGLRHTITALRGWIGQDPRTLWLTLRDRPVPADPGERVAVWTVLQWWSYGSKPVRAEGGRWVTAGMDTAKAYRAEARKKALATGNKSAESWAQKSQLLDMVVRALSLLPPLSGLTVLQARAQDVTPVPGALVLIDPPYKGTTCQYGHEFPRAEVLLVARRWHDAGCRVVLCEQEPLPLHGWHSRQLGRAASGGRTFSAQQQEWITMNFEPRGQEQLRL